MLKPRDYVRITINNSSDIIYAIEEPETSQHLDHQEILIKALLNLANQPNAQVLITTHSGFIVKKLQEPNLRLVLHDDSGNKRIVDVPDAKLPYRSLNEINCLAFGEYTEEYHNELYGHIEKGKLLNAYKTSEHMPKKSYIDDRLKGKLSAPKIISLSEYIRHQIHHPENKENIPYTKEELKDSINLMREFISNNIAMVSVNSNSVG